MTGPATLANDADAAASARARLDRASEAIGGFEAAQREVIVELVCMWATAAWRVAGCTSAKAWLCAYTPLSEVEARRLESVAGLCAAQPDLAAAVADGRLSVARASRLAKAVTKERAPYLDQACVAAFVGLADDPATDDAGFAQAVRFWAGKVDELVEPRRVPPHVLYTSERLFGGGDVNGSLSPAAFARLVAGLDAFIQDPDPADAPYRRSLAERRADALDDLTAFALTHACDADNDTDEDGWDGAESDADHDGADGADGASATGDEPAECGDEPLVPDVDAEDVFDGVAHVDELDAALDHPDEDDPLELLRLKIRKAQARRHRRRHRQVRPRAGACVNVHVDLSTLLGTRAIDDFDGLVMHADGWGLTRAAVDELACDATWVAALFAGRNRFIDANTATEAFNRSQRRVVAGRDRGCVFPGCTAHPRRCELHHLQPRAQGGPTVVLNAAMLCRFHHRLVHHHAWSLAIDADGRWVATDPHGIEWKARPTHQRAA